jgi:TonB-linked SusC/RagA family outer membrane protein
MLTLLALFAFTVQSLAQTSTVKGIVHDEGGNALPGVSVIVNGSGRGGTVTDINGRFSVSATNSDVLTFSYIGMKTVKVKVSGKRNFDITLVDDATTLNDIVVVGYGTARKESLTGAVSAMKGDELLKGPSTNVSSLLGGKMPGLTSVQTSGEPGNDQASLRIRGSQFAALYIVDGMPRSINDIDPNDIESISVLKDGAAAAVYGLNAAGGVIIVTTRKGREGKPQVQYDGQYGISVNANFPEFMNGPEFAHYYNMANMMDQLASGTITSRDQYVPVFTKANVEAMLNGDPTDGWDNVDYIDKVFGTGTNMKHNLSLQGGNQDMKYYIGAGFMNQNGNIDNFTYRRYNMRTNITAKVAKDWTIDVGAVGTIGRRSTPAYSSGGADDGSESSGEVGWLSIGHQAIMMHPYLPEKYNGKYTGTIPNNASVSYSPLAAIHDSGYKKTRSTEINTNISITYDAPWLKGLRLKATGSYDNLSSSNKNLDTPYQTYVYNTSTGEYTLADDPRDAMTNLNHVGEGHYSSEQLIGQLSAEYVQQFGKHHVDALLLVEGRDNKSNSMAAYAYKVPFAELPELDFGTATTDPIGGSSYHTRQAGYVFRLKYDYNNTYLAEFSGRYDGSYNFSGNVSGKRWGFFPSFSAAWRISQEKFMESTHDWLNDLKVRASIGLLGNDAVTPYSFLNTYSFGSNVVLGGEIYSSLYTSGIANPELTWSKTRSFDLGFDATLWDGLLGVEFDWFYNLNYDLLTAMGGDKAPSMGGYYPTYANNNRYSNYGIEWNITHRNKFTLGGRPFRYNIDVNMTWAKSKWLRYPDSPNTQEWRKVVGTSVDSYMAWIADGLFRSEEEIDNSAWYGTRPNVGDIKYRDLNGDGQINEQDKARVGRSNRPQIMGGLNIGASWNGFDLNMQFTAGFKFDVSLLGTYYNGYDDNTIWSQTFKEGANSPLWLVQNSYSIDNPDGEYPRITLGQVSHGGDNGLASTFWMKKGDYLRLKTAQLGYTLPKSWLHALNIERIRIYVEGSNLFTIDDLPKGVDPESPRVNNGYYPQQRTFMGGINITF